MIAFTCPACTMLLNVHDDQAGTKVPCPSCGQRLRVPQCPESESPTIMGKLVLPTSRTSAPDEGARTIRCVCPHCQAIIKAPPKAAGAKAPCPRCSLLVEIPVPKAGHVEEPLTVIPVRSSATPIAPPPATLPLEPPSMLARNTPPNQQTQPLVPLVCQHCQTTVYVPTESTETGVQCPRCTRPVTATASREHTPRRDAPVIVNVINNNSGSGSERLPVRTEQAAYRGGSSGGSAVGLLILFIAIIGVGGIAFFLWQLSGTSSGSLHADPSINGRLLRVHHLDKEIEEYQARASESARLGDGFAQRKYLELALKSLEELEREIPYIIAAHDSGSEARQNWDKRRVGTEKYTQATRELITTLKKMGF